MQNVIDTLKKMGLIVDGKIDKVYKVEGNTVYVSVVPVELAKEITVNIGFALDSNTTK